MANVPPQVDTSPKPSRGHSSLSLAATVTGVVCLASFGVALVSPRFSKGDEFDVFVLSAWVLALVTVPSLLLTVGLAIAAHMRRRG